MRSTPTAACEIHTNVEPLDLRREAAVMEGFERFKRLDANHPNRKLVESKRPKQRLKQNSILDIAEKLSNKYKLPENREQKCIFDQNHPPHKEMRKAHIKLDIDGTCSNKKDTDPVDLLLSAERTIGQYPEEWIHIYTDGSAFKGTVNAGYGSRIQFPDKTCEELFDSCGAHRTNAEAEAIDVPVPLALP